ncbi:site-specific tyrosine recombinase/integron integrase [Cuniculiplasma sp. SKW3]|uniref:site-specific tyrosine recombinase/integron integrase n=1 Tax=unclassified Cuniculiplasma TaxID=2619706 RepID=UPI003FD4E76C
MENDDIESDLTLFRNRMIAERRSPYTVKQYSFFAKMFLDFSSKRLRECTQKDIESFKLFLATQKRYSKNSQYLAIKAIKHMYIEMGLNVPKNLEAPKRSKKVPVYLSKGEVESILRMSRNDIIIYTIINTFLYSGMRVSELCSLRNEDIDFESGSIRITSGKGDKERIVLVPEEVLTILKEYAKWKISENRISEYFFVSGKMGKYHPSTVEKMIREIAKSSGIGKRVTPHTLRHTFATSILKNGGDIRFIQRMLGHSSIGTTEIYTHIDDETMREMYSRYRPRYGEEEERKSVLP